MLTEHAPPDIIFWQSSQLQSAGLGWSVLGFGSSDDAARFGGRGRGGFGLQDENDSRYSLEFEGGEMQRTFTAESLS